MNKNELLRAAIEVELEEGQKQGLDILLYDKPYYLPFQLHEIRLGLESGVDVELYAKEEFEWRQMKEIRKGLEEGLDVSMYANPQFDYVAMRELRKAQRSQVDLISYIEKGYESDVLEEIRLGLEEGIALEEYINKTMYAQQIQEVCRGLQESLEVQWYTKEKYGWRQMREIRRGLEKRLDVSLYCNPLYNYLQMHEIRLGLEEKLDVTLYAKLMYTCQDMRREREKLLQQKDLFREDEILEALRLIENDDKPDMSEGTVEKQEKLQGVDFVVSQDSMKVYLLIDSAKRRKLLTKDMILKELKRLGIVYGLMEDAIEKLVSRNVYNNKTKIAEGKPPQPGKDGWFEYCFQTQNPMIPKPSADGSVDFTEVEPYEYIRTGQILAIYHKALKGADGITVFGDVVSAQTGNDIPPLQGHGFEIGQDHVTYVARINGVIQFHDDILIISPMLFVNGDVTAISGKIKFDGNIRVSGSVHSGGYIEAEGDVIIDKYMETGMIKAGGKVIIKQGARSAHKCIIVAKDDIYGNFFESTIIAGEKNIISNSIINSNVDVAGSVIITGSKGVLMGGRICAMNTIEVQNLGNAVHLLTELDVGYNERVIRRKRELAVLKRKLKSEINIFMNAVRKLEAVSEDNIEKHNELYQKIGYAIAIKQEELQEIKDEEKKYDQLLKRQNIVPVKISGMAHGGVCVKIDQIAYRLQGAIDKIGFKKKKNKIVMVKY